MHIMCMQLCGYLCIPYFSGHSLCHAFQSGQVLTGFVKKSESYGVFVEFPGNLVGLCPNKVRMYSRYWSSYLPTNLTMYVTTKASAVEPC